MRRRAKLDRNHNQIADVLRDCGCSVQSLAAVGDGVPDLLVGRQGVNYLIEIKNPQQEPRKRKLTRHQVEFFERWRGHCLKVQTVEEALKAVGL